jgi:hypothetical protein
LDHCATRTSSTLSQNHFAVSLLQRLFNWVVGDDVLCIYVHDKYDVRSVPYLSGFLVVSFIPILPLTVFTNHNPFRLYLHKNSLKKL